MLGLLAAGSTGRGDSAPGLGIRIDADSRKGLDNR